MPSNIIIINESDELNWFVGDSKMLCLLKYLDKIGYRIKYRGIGKKHLKYLRRMEIENAREAKEENEQEILKRRKSIIIHKIDKGITMETRRR